MKSMRARARFIRNYSTAGGTRFRVEGLEFRV
jgi:hypothetical protein